MELAEFDPLVKPTRPLAKRIVEEVINKLVEENDEYPNSIMDILVEKLKLEYTTQATGITKQELIAFPIEDLFDHYKINPENIIKSESEDSHANELTEEEKEKLRLQDLQKQEEHDTHERESKQKIEQEEKRKKDEEEKRGLEELERQRLEEENNRMSVSAVDGRLLEILNGKKAKSSKETIGLSLQHKYASALRKFKKDTDMDMSEAVEHFIDLIIPQYVKD